jgi:hypothetical protein
LHRLVLDGRAAQLRRWYPSTGGRWDTRAAWSDVVAVARGQTAALRTALDQPPQTNEIGRSAALIGALLTLVRRFPFPVRLFEIGASAGLNLSADYYLYRFSGGQWGPADAAVVIDDAWRGRPPPDSNLRIAERHGYDIAPIDVTSNDATLTLLSYVWPDMPIRLQRLQAAIEVARRVPARLDRMSAATAVKQLRLAPGTLTVLWHSVTWQYLTETEQQQTAAELVALGATADAAAPFVWLSLELRPLHTPDEAPQELLVQARCWPNNTDEILGTSAPHGLPVTWK